MSGTRSALFFVGLIATSLLGACGGEGHAPDGVAASSPTTPTGRCGLSDPCTNPDNITVTTTTIESGGSELAAYNLATDGTHIYSFRYAMYRIDPDANTSTLIAGDPVDVASTDGTGTAARFFGISGAAFDGTTMVLTESFKFILRKMNTSTLAVSLFAGTSGTSGTEDSSNPPLHFDTIMGIVRLGDYYYTTEVRNHTIRRVALMGTTITVAGVAHQNGSTDGVGANARFNGPLGITGTGPNIYISDQMNYVIRKMNVITRRVTTLAGTPGVSGFQDGVGTAAKFDLFGAGLATDGTNIFVADSGNNAIRKVHIATGAVSTLIGPNGTGVDGTGAVATTDRPASLLYFDGTLYFTEYGTSKIRTIR